VAAAAAEAGPIVQGPAGGSEARSGKGTTRGLGPPAKDVVLLPYRPTRDAVSVVVANEGSEWVELALLLEPSGRESTRLGPGSSLIVSGRIAQVSGEGPRGQTVSAEEGLRRAQVRGVGVGYFCPAGAAATRSLRVANIGPEAATLVVNRRELAAGTVAEILTLAPGEERPIAGDIRDVAVTTGSSEVEVVLEV
jgi:hypothetical protein